MWLDEVHWNLYCEDTHRELLYREKSSTGEKNKYNYQLKFMFLKHIMKILH